MLNIENVRRIFELRRACLLQRRKDGEYSDRHARADWSLFQEAFTAGYQYAQEEQDSNLTCDQCCNELGMDDGSIRLCGECKENQSNKWVKVKHQERLYMILKCPKCDEIALKDDGQCLNCEFERAKSQHNTSGQNVNGWISVKDRLPEKSGFYIVFVGEVNSDFFHLHKKDFHHYQDFVTHWQPMPEPPKE